MQSQTDRELCKPVTEPRLREEGSRGQEGTRNFGVKSPVQTLGTTSVPLSRTCNNTQSNDLGSLKVTSSCYSCFALDVKMNEQRPTPSGRGRGLGEGDYGPSRPSPDSCSKYTTLKTSTGFTFHRGRQRNFLSLSPVPVKFEVGGIIELNFYVLNHYKKNRRKGEILNIYVTNNRCTVVLPFHKTIYRSLKYNIGIK